MTGPDDIVYLDYAATTPMEPAVAETLSGLLTLDQDFANPSSNHVAGRRSRLHVDRALEQLAGALNCIPRSILLTSGATEADNLAIIGGAHYRADRGRHLVTMPVEHKAVTDAFHALEREGFDVTWLEPERDGLLDLDKLKNAFRDDTQLVSIMHVNNETGVIQDIEGIGELCRERDALFHVDAAQSFGKLPLDVSRLPVDLVSVTGHKIYGPKGIGALYMADRPGCRVEPLLFGGGQQRGIRPGTLPVHQIAAFGHAAEIAMSRHEQDLEHLSVLRERLWSKIRDIPGVVRNGSADASFPGILNVSVADIEGESLLLALEPLCVATGSACNSQSQEPSYVLRALGLDDLEAQSAIRFSFGRPTTIEDVDLAAARYKDAVRRLRALAPTRAA